MTSALKRGRTSVLLHIAASAVLAAPGAARGGEAAAPAGSVVAGALSVTQTRGAATVVIFTSSDKPDSVRLWDEFHEGAWARQQRGLVQVVNVKNERDATYVRSSGVTKFPTVLVYTRGPKGLVQAAAITDCTTPQALALRLRDLDLTAGAPDLSVVAAAHSPDVYPTQQNAAPPSPQPQPQPQPVYQSLPQPQPVMQAVPQATMTAGLVQVPSQNLVIQQAPPQVFLAPTQAPVVYMPMTAGPAQPTLPMAAAAPSPNLFLPAPAPTLTAAPAPSPTLAVAAAPALSAAPAPATVGTLAAVTNQTLSLPASASRTRVRVRGPGILGASLARLGERMIGLGRARIETVQETTLEAPTTRSAPTGLTTISTTSTTPVVPQQPTLMLQSAPQPQQVCKTPCEAPPANPQPPGLLPSPPGGAPSKR